VAQDPDSDKEMSGPPPAVLYSDPGRPPEQVRHELRLFTGCLEDLACSTWKWNNNKMARAVLPKKMEESKTKDSTKVKTMMPNLFLVAL
jgi:hypothetical protein